MEVKHHSVAGQVALIESLPPFPMLSNLLKSFMDADESGDLRTLISYIESDPTLVAKIISTSNSACFHSGTDILSVRDACARLGLVQLKGIVYSLIMAKRFNTRQCQAFKLSNYWYDTMLVAHCAKHLTAKVTIANFEANQSQVYCIALLFRIGLLALVHLYPQQMNTLLSENQEETLCEKEKSQFDQLDHFDIGALLLQHWALPEVFPHCLSLAKTPGYSGKNCELIWILQRVSALLDADDVTAHDELDQKLGLSAQDITAVLDACEKDKAWISDFSRLFQ